MKDNHPTQAANVAVSEGGGMLGGLGQEGIPTFGNTDINQSLSLGNIDKVTEAITKNPPLGSGPIEACSGMVNRHGVAEMDESKHIDLKQVSAGDLGNLKTPTVQGDIQLDKGIGTGGISIGGQS